ncbi:hypothetical protein [Flavitalea sp.]|nr:hypothetical protein [Flavitalea sp.]
MSFLKVAYINRGKVANKNAAKAQYEADMKEFCDRIMRHQSELCAKCVEKNRKISLLKVDFHNSPREKNGTAEYQLKLYLSKALNNWLPYIENEKSGKFKVIWHGEKRRTILPLGFSSDLTKRITAILNK